MYYPDVHPGDIFTPDAALANDIRHLLNAENTQGEPAELPQHEDTLTVSVRNSGTAALAAGQPVQFPSAAPLQETILPVRGFTTAVLPWGIVTSPLDPGDIGECVLNGAIAVTLDAGSGHYALPDGTAFRHGTAGLPILAEYTEGTATRGIVAAGCQFAPGGGGTATPSAYDGPFAVSLVPGGQTAAVRGGIVRRGQSEDAVADGVCALSGSACGVYLAARYNTVTYAVDYAFCAAASIVDIPCPADSTQYAHKLAQVAGGSVSQTQYGDIVVTGVWI